jgi:hypothetical protein
VQASADVPVVDIKGAWSHLHAFHHITSSYQFLNFHLYLYIYLSIMSNPEEQSEPAIRTFQSITGNGTTSPTLTRTNTNGSKVHRTNTAGSRIHRTNSSVSHKESKDPNLDVSLPYRTFSDGANLEEYTEEKPEGEIAGPFEPDGQHRYKLVTFVPDDPANPKNWSKAYKVCSFFY